MCTYFTERVNEKNVEEERAHGPIIAGREDDDSYSSDCELDIIPIQHSRHVLRNSSGMMTLVYITKNRRLSNTR
jgi:hypothetical protein